MEEDFLTSLENKLGEKIRYSFNGGLLQTMSGRKLFVKKGNVSDKYACEAHGLMELHRQAFLPVANVVDYGDSYIVTDYIEPQNPMRTFFERFGRELARMHKVTAVHYGFYENNYIGDNTQINVTEGDERSDWSLFYFNKRLMFQFRLAENNGYLNRSIAIGFTWLESHIKALLSVDEESPALLHGDLWHGNFICRADGRAVLLDPAVYYGHREADLAMTRLFGGFPEEFYGGYEKEYPLHPGWQHREPLYRLYHVMNHLNLFGRCYLREVERILDYYVR